MTKEKAQKVLDEIRDVLRKNDTGLSIRDTGAYADVFFHDGFSEKASGPSKGFVKVDDDGEFFVYAEIG